jgi:hypothetical protein
MRPAIDTLRPTRHGGCWAGSKRDRRGGKVNIGWAGGPLPLEKQGRMGYLSLCQGIYFFVMGIWPLFSMRTFEAVTGPKTDRWLVKTMGVLIAVIGAVLVLAGIRGHI